ncbi:Charged multivesicular body protein [Wickerhamomyces ciferrii]|uniref:Charged multivesicular body protein n=1 Tax=Wickerhamomyces ciferrii (strain ATCC 14091 / BCRC 22168 / CBS 111 / JCM 3599 / NBRC 0793 / NRRL Y-1031 F-60-10) TaxID=1206466 RepID=K0K6Y6_WICCF|nr:Charged multivesicular body protein [Wickerhamomyces ciferrii]CCH40650.1 Charged multivesicular body protein [Wickerhamomyces ciferrii]
MSDLRETVVNHSLFTKSRLYSLYSDFAKLKDVNPDGYEANLIAWKSLITTFFQNQSFKDTFALQTTGLLEDLTLPDYGKPMALSSVLEELVAAGELIPLQQYKSKTESIYTRHWVRPALNWAVNKFLINTSYKIGDGKNNLKGDTLVSRKILEIYARELENSVAFSTPGQSKQVFTKDELREYLNGLNIKAFGNTVKLSELDFEILLLFLQRDTGKIRSNDTIVKLSNEEITEEDIAIAELKSTLKNLNLKSDELQGKIDSISIKLRESLQKKNSKDLSLNLLRSKKLAEKSLGTQLSLINQLDSVIYKIDESSSNVQLLKALENGTGILKNLNSQIGGVERLEKIMDDLEEEKYQSDKISSELYRLNPQVNEDDIEEEFEALLAQDKASKTTNKINEDKEEEKLAEKLSNLGLSPTEIQDGSTKAKEQNSNEAMTN